MVVDDGVGGGIELKEPVVACPTGEGDGRLLVFLWTGSWNMTLWDEIRDFNT